MPQGDAAESSAAVKYTTLYLKGRLLQKREFSHNLIFDVVRVRFDQTRILTVNSARDTKRRSPNMFFGERDPWWTEKVLRNPTRGRIINHMHSSVLAHSWFAANVLFFISCCKNNTWMYFYTVHLSSPSPRPTDSNYIHLILPWYCPRSGRYLLKYRGGARRYVVDWTRLACEGHNTVYTCSTSDLMYKSQFQKWGMFYKLKTL